MTDHDLDTLLRADVARSEPPWSADPAVPVRLGRRRLRARRLAAAGASAAVLAVGAMVGAAVGVPHPGAVPDHAVDPASQRALEEYDAAAMPRLMDDHVRAVLSRDVPDLGPDTFTASDGNGAPLPSRLYDKASGMRVEYGTDAHLFSVSLSHARSEAEGSAERYCADGLADGTYLSCEVSTGSEGETVISKLWALRPFHGDGFMVVRADQLTTTNPDRLYFEHEVKVVKSETLVTYVDERVQAPTRDAAAAAFEVPVADLVEIGTDPVLVMPAPPTDDSGCRPWTLDPGVRYSC